MRDEAKYPHTKDVLERDQLDDGFSKGWGLHFMPAINQVIDMHIHFEAFGRRAITESLKRYRNWVQSCHMNHAIIILPMFDKESFKNDRFKAATYFQSQRALRRYIKAVKMVPNIHPMLYLDYKNPDEDLVKAARDMGICGIKLHNAPVIMEGTHPSCWLSKRWQAVFKQIEELNLPVLWHVTQRLSEAKYVGGEKNAYWQEGWKQGTTYTNQDLLDVYLEVASNYPGIQFIGAHQLHMGWDRLSDIMDNYNNVLIDTSIGCVVKRFDRLYESDREYIRDFFIKYQDRIVIGTDLLIDRKSTKNDYINHYDAYFRFLRQLRLPQDTLDAVTHKNVMRVFDLS